VVVPAVRATGTGAEPVPRGHASGARGRAGPRGARLSSGLREGRLDEFYENSSMKCDLEMIFGPKRLARNSFVEGTVYQDAHFCSVPLCDICYLSYSLPAQVPERGRGIRGKT
jgi:hypothetical protein